MAAIRSVALVLMKREGRLLLAEHNEGGRTFYRPVGGTVEYGERALAAARREVQEELGLAVEELRPLGVIEDIFTLDDEVHHQIVFLYEADWPEAVACVEPVVARESDGVEFTCSWRSLEELADLDRPFYPEGITDLLRTVLGR